MSSEEGFLINKYRSLAKRINRRFLYMSEKDIEYILSEFEKFRRIQDTSKMRDK